MSRSFRQMPNTIVGRMLLYMVAPTLLVLTIVVAIAIHSAFHSLCESAEEELEVRASLVASSIECKSNKAALTAQRMAEAQLAGMFGDREASLEFARIILENSNEFTGVSYGYEPNADNEDAASLGKQPAESMDPSGRFIPYWFVAAQTGRAIKLEPLVDVEKSLYYAEAKQEYARSGKARCLATEPYVYQGKMVVEHVYPIVIDGEFKGVAGVDFALADVEEGLRRVADNESIDLFLISSRGKFIAATTDDPGSTGTMLKTSSVAETKYRELFAKGGDLVGTISSKPVLSTDPLDGTLCYYAVSSLPTDGWTLIIRQAETSVLAPIRSQLLFRLTIALLGGSLMIALWVFMTVRLSRRINQAVEAAERVAEGDLTREIPQDKAHDETGILLRALHKMTYNLNDLVGNVKRASVQLNSTATELAATSREQESSARDFGATTNQIAAAAKQISATSGELLATMHEVHDIAFGTAELATTGRTDLQAMETNMRGLEQATASIGDKLATINERASKITGIVTTITKVADQTNLLSVNAAIEAEKAGEYGVGFLVVAREIRRLADQTAGATLDIEQMVQQMHAAVSAGVMEMDHFTDQVRRSVSDVVRISTQMEEIIERVDVNTSHFKRVHESMQSQAQGAEQISEAMASLTETASQTAEAVVDYSRAASELREAIGSLQSSVASFQLQAWCSFTPENRSSDGH